MKAEWCRAKLIYAGLTIHTSWGCLMICSIEHTVIHKSQRFSKAGGDSTAEVPPNTRFQPTAPRPRLAKAPFQSKRSGRGRGG